jgi:hypothetical protein
MWQWHYITTLKMSPKDALFLAVRQGRERREGRGKSKYNLID